MNDGNTSRKTLISSLSSSKQNIVQSDKKNVLDNYRSYTYNFTLAGLRKEAVNNPNIYRNKTLDLIILKSGGKGIIGLSNDVSGVTRKIGETTEVLLSGFEGMTEIKTGVFEEDKITGQQLVNSFNQKSPGRFDMYLDNVTIDTVMSFSKPAGATMVTGLNFRVIEPYSINGFLEALHVTAIASGYTNYTQASFLLKMEFIGYSDDDNFELSSAKVIENSTRYFPIKFTGVTVEINEKGTVYNCTAIPWGDQAFGQANKLKRPISISGWSIKDILKNFADSLNEQIKADDKIANAGRAANDSDEYEIVFPQQTDDGYDYNKTNLIGNAALLSIMKDNAIYKFEDPSKERKKQTPREKDAAPEELKLHPAVGNSPVVQFADGHQINEIIAAVIRDSEYVKDILENLIIDDDGFINYFVIKGDVFNKKEINPVTRKPYQKFRYSVLPYKVHFTKIPGLASQKFNPEKINRLSLREYNYIYTGLNTDIINFKLNFNNLFFEAIPAAMGNNDQPGSVNKPVQSGDSRVQLNPDNLDDAPQNQNPVPTVKQIALDPVTDVVNARQPDNDPYYLLSKNLHNVIIDSKANLLSGTIDIVGDPLFLVTGGIGNYDPKPGNILGLTSDGEADHLRGEVLITINFRNPVDIQPLEKGGMMYFETEKLPFSGVYRVLQVKNIFNNGEFKQELQIVRYPGQIVGKQRETIVQEKFLVQPKPNAQVVPSTTQGTAQGGQPATELGALSLLGRGLPSPGLPGILSNFVQSAGSLGGVAGGLLNQVSGFVSRGLNQLTGANSVFGSNLPGNINQLASGIRMQASGLINSLNSNLAGAAAITQAANVVSSKFSVADASQTLASDLVERSKLSLNQLSIQGSGIGDGASVLVNRLGSLNAPVPQIGNAGKAIVNVAENSVLSNSSFSLTGGLDKSLSPSNLSSAISLGSNGAAQLVSSVGSNISKLTQAVPSDPAAIAAKFGINSQQLSGLGGDLQSKVIGQLNDISKKVPEDVDLGVATSRGLLLDYVSVDKLPNIPATAPYLTAPGPQVDTKFYSDLAKSKGQQALANSFGVSNIESISGNLLPNNLKNNLVSQVPSAFRNPLEGLSNSPGIPDATVLGGKLSAAESLISSVSPVTRSVESQLSSMAARSGENTALIRNLSNSVSGQLGSISAGQSPLGKLISNSG